MLLRRKVIVLIVSLIKELSEAEIRHLLFMRSHQKGSHRRVKLFSSILSHSINIYWAFICARYCSRLWGYNSEQERKVFVPTELPFQCYWGRINSEVSERPWETETVQNSSSRYLPGLFKRVVCKGELDYFCTLKSK